MGAERVRLLRSYWGVFLGVREFSRGELHAEPCLIVDHNLRTNKPAKQQQTDHR